MTVDNTSTSSNNSSNNTKSSYKPLTTNTTAPATPSSPEVTKEEIQQYQKDQEFLSAYNNPHSIISGSNVNNIAGGTVNAAVKLGIGGYKVLDTAIRGVAGLTKDTLNQVGSNVKTKKGESVVALGEEENQLRNKKKTGSVSLRLLEIKNQLDTTITRYDGTKINPRDITNIQSKVNAAHKQTIEVLDTALNWVNGLGNDTKNVNFQDYLTKDVAEVDQAYKDGDTAKGTYLALTSMYKAVVNNPGAVAEYFIQSFPAMIVAGGPALPAYAAASYEEKIQQNEIDYTKLMGKLPDKEAKTNILAMSLIDVTADILADRIAMKGLPHIKLGFSKIAEKSLPTQMISKFITGLESKIPNAVSKAAALSTKLGRPLAKGVTEAIVQPLQEAASGATSEYATQSAVSGGTQIDTTKIVAAGLTEGTVGAGIGGFHGTRKVFEKHKGETINTKDIKSTIHETRQSLTSLNTGIDKSTGLPFKSESNKIEANNKIIEDAATSLSGVETNIAENDVELNTKISEEINTITDVVTSQMDKVTGDTALSEKDLVTEISNVTDNKLSKEAASKSIDVIMHNMDTSDNIPANQAQELLDSGKLTKQQEEIVTSYITAKTANEVSTEIKSGVNPKYKGAITHAKFINFFSKQGNKDAAQKSLKELSDFAQFMYNKKQGLIDVVAYNSAVVKGQDVAPLDHLVNIKLNSKGLIEEFSIPPINPNKLSDSSKLKIIKAYQGNTSGLGELLQIINKDIGLIDYYHNRSIATYNAAFNAAKGTNQQTNPQVSTTQQNATQEPSNVSQRASTQVDQKPVVEQPKAKQNTTTETPRDSALRQIAISIGITDEAAILDFIKNANIASENTNTNKDSLKIETNEVGKILREAVVVDFHLGTSLQKNLIPENSVNTKSDYASSKKIDGKNPSFSDLYETSENIKKNKSTRSNVGLLAVNDSVEDINYPEIASGMSMFTKVNNFFAAVLYNKDKFNFSNKQITNISKLAAFSNKFHELAASILSAYDSKAPTALKYGNDYRDRFAEEPILRLFHKDADGNNTLDPNIEGILAMVGFKWLATRAKATLINSNEMIQSLYPKDSVNIPYHLLKYAGVTQTILADTLGKEAYKMLGIKIKDTVNANEEARLIKSLGLTILQTLEAGNYIKSYSATRGFLGYQTGNLKATVNFIRISSDHIIENNKGQIINTSKKNILLSKGVDNIINSYDSINGSTNETIKYTLEGILGTKDTTRFPSTEIKPVAKKFQRSGQYRSKRLIADLTKMQSVKWNIKDSMKKLLSITSEKDLKNKTKILKNILGYVEDLYTVPAYRLHAVQSINLTILREIEHAFLFYKNLTEANKEDFYYSYNTISNGRNMISEHSFNPQASKFVRHLITTNDWNVTVDSNNIDLFEEAIKDMFKGGKFKGLSLDQLLQESDILDALDSLDKNIFSSAVNKVIAETGLNLATLDGLQNLLNYKNNSKKLGFETDIYLERDATTSGTIISHINFGLNDPQSIQKLNAGGWLSNNASLDERKQEGLLDNYEQFISLWYNNLPDIRQNPRLQALTHILGLLSRDDGKPVVMRTNYGAGTATLISSFEESSLIKLYEKLEQASKDPEAKITLGKALDILDVKIDKNFNINTDMLPIHVENQFKKVIHLAYSLAMQKAAEQFNAPMNKRVIPITESFTLSSWIFQWALEFQIEQTKQDNNGLLTKPMLKEILDSPSMQKLLPRIKTPGANTRDEGIAAYKTTKVASNLPHDLVASRTKKGSKVKSSSTHIRNIEFVAPGVATGVRAVQSIDDALIRNVLREYDILSLFDANVAGLNTSNVATKAYNQGSLKTLDQYSIAEAAKFNLTEIKNALEEAFGNDGWAEGANKNLEKYLSRQVDKEIAQQVPNLIFNIASSKNIFQIIENSISTLNNTDKQIIEGKKFIYNNTLTVDQTGGSDVGVENPNYNSADKNDDTSIADTITEALNRLLKSNNDTNDILNNQNANKIDPKEFDPNNETPLMAQNSEKIFNNLHSAKVDSPTHVDHLRNTLTNIVNKTLSSIDNIKINILNGTDETIGGFKTASNQIFLKINTGIANAVTEMSAKETYVHELVHAITGAALVDPINEKLVTDIRRIRKELLSKLIKDTNNKPYEIFLPKDIEGNIVYGTDPDAEIAAAKKQFDYIFNNTSTNEIGWQDINGNTHKVSSNQGLHEFVAIGLTNEVLNNELRKIIFTTNKRGNRESMASKLEGIFLDILDWIARALTQTKQTTTTANVALQNMVQSLTFSYQQNASKASQAVHKLDEYNDLAAYNISKWIMEPLAKANFKSLDYLRDNPGKTLRIPKAALSLGLYAFNELNPSARTVYKRTFKQTQNDGSIKDISFSKFDEYHQALIKTRQRSKFSSRSFVAEIWQDIQGPMSTWAKKFELKLIASKQHIEHARERRIKATKNLFLKSFHLELSDIQEEALTTVAAKTDLTALFSDFSGKDIPELLKILNNTEGARTEVISSIKKELLSLGKEGNYFLSQANHLANYMVSGVTNIQIGLNAHVIAHGLLTNHEGKKLVNVANKNQVEKLLDKYITLLAIQKTSPSAIKVFSDIAAQEFGHNNKNNGISFLLDILRSHKEESLQKNFNNNKVHMTKGYTKDILDPRANIKFAPKSDNHKLAKEGYKDYGPLEIDPNDPFTKKSKLNIYVSNLDGLSTRDRGILALKTKRHMGFSVSTGPQSDNQNTADFIERKQQTPDIYKKGIQEVLQQLQNADYSIRNKGTSLVPILDGEGNTVDYRYVMRDHTKRTLLKQNLRMSDVIASMEGQIIEKNNSILVNKSTFKDLAKEWALNSNSSPLEYIKVAANSLNADIREMYRLLPNETRVAARKAFGGDIYIREQYLNILFGVRRMRIHQGKLLGTAEAIWKEIVAAAKTNIVIKMFSTIKNNVISNTVAGVLMGIPPWFMIKEQARGVRLIHNYLINQAKADEIHLKLKTIKTKNSNEAKKLRSELVNLTDAMNISPIKPLINMGMFTTLIEDIDTKKSEFSYKSSFQTWINELFGLSNTKYKGKNAFRKILKHAYMTEDTATFKLLTKATQYSDFVSRFAVYSYKTQHSKPTKVEIQEYKTRVTLDKNGKEHIGLTTKQIQIERKEKARELAINMYINYETPSSKWLNYANDVGLALFTKYPIRIMRVIANIMRTKPLNLIAMYAIEDLLNMNISDPTDTSLLNLSNPYEILKDASTMSGLNLLTDPFK